MSQAKVLAWDLGRLSYARALKVQKAAAANLKEVENRSVFSTQNKRLLSHCAGLKLQE